MSSILEVLQNTEKQLAFRTTDFLENQLINASILLEKGYSQNYDFYKAMGSCKYAEDVQEFKFVK